MSNSNNSQLNIPQAREAMDRSVYCGHTCLMLLCKNGLPVWEVHFHDTKAILC